MLNVECCWEAVEKRDAGQDDTFLYGVMTTGVYCRPSCAGRRPLRKNVRFYETGAAAEDDGLRACKHCRPLARRARFSAGGQRGERKNAEDATRD